MWWYCHQLLSWDKNILAIFTLLLPLFLLLYFSWAELSDLTTVTLCHYILNTLNIHIQVTLFFSTVYAVLKIPLCTKHRSKAACTFKIWIYISCWKYQFEQASLFIKSRMVEFNITIQPQVILPYSKMRYYTILVGFEDLVQSWSMYFPLYYIGKTSGGSLGFSCRHLISCLGTFIVKITTSHFK